MGFFGSSRPKPSPHRAIVASTYLRRPSLISHDPCSDLVVLVQNGSPYLNVVGREFIVQEVDVGRQCESWVQAEFIGARTCLFALLSAKVCVIVDIASGEEYVSFSSHLGIPGNTSPFSSMAIVPGLPFIYIGRDNGTICAYNWVHREWSQYTVHLGQMASGAPQAPDDGHSVANPEGRPSATAVRLLKSFPCDPNAMCSVSDSCSIVKWYVQERRSSAVFHVPPESGSVISIAISDGGAYCLAGTSSGALLLWREKEKKADRTCAPRWVISQTVPDWRPAPITQLFTYTVAAGKAESEEGYVTLGIWQQGSEELEIRELVINLKDKTFHRDTKLIGEGYSRIVPVFGSPWQSQRNIPTQYLATRARSGDVVLLKRRGVDGSTNMLVGVPFRPTTPWGKLEGQIPSVPDAAETPINSCFLMPQRNPRLLGIAREPSEEDLMTSKSQSGESPFDLYDLKATDVDRPYCLLFTSQAGALAMCRAQPFTNVLVRGGGGVFEEPRYLSIVKVVPCCAQMIAIALSVPPAGTQRWPALLIFDLVTLSTQKLDLHVFLSEHADSTSPVDIAVLEESLGCTDPYGVPASPHGDAVDEGISVAVRTTCNTIVLVSLAHRRVTRVIPAVLFPQATTISSVMAFKCSLPAAKGSKVSPPPRWFLACTLKDSGRIVVVDTMTTTVVACKEPEKTSAIATLKIESFRRSLTADLFQNDEENIIAECVAMNLSSQEAKLALHCNIQFRRPLAFSLGFGLEVMFAVPLPLLTDVELPASIPTEGVKVLANFEFISGIGGTVLALVIGAFQSLLVATVGAQRTYKTEPPPPDPREDAKSALPFEYCMSWKPINVGESPGAAVGLRACRDASTGSATLHALVAPEGVDPHVPPQQLRERVDACVLGAAATGCFEPRNSDGVFENGSVVKGLRFATPPHTAIPPFLSWPIPNAPPGANDLHSHLAIIEDAGTERLRAVWMGKPGGTGSAEALVPGVFQDYADSTSQFVVHALCPSTLAIYEPSNVTTPSTSLPVIASLDLRSASNLGLADAKLLKNASIADIALTAFQDGTPAVLVVTVNPVVLLLFQLGHLDCALSVVLPPQHLPPAAVVGNPTIRITSKWICNQLHVYLLVEDEGIASIHVVVEKCDSESERSQTPLHTYWRATPQRYTQPFHEAFEKSPLRSVSSNAMPSPPQVANLLVAHLPPPPKASASKEVGFFKSFVTASYSDNLKKVAETLAPAVPKETFDDFTSRVAKTANLSEAEREELLGSGRQRKTTGGGAKKDGKMGGVQDGISDTKNVMNENLQKLNERGERIERMQEKTGWLEEEASEFARLSAQLKEKQRKSWWL